MPRRKQPPSLKKLTVATIARMVSHGCMKAIGKEEVSTICEYAVEIPPFAAEAYLIELLKLMSDLEKTKNLRSALPLQCHKLTFSKLKTLSTGVKKAMLANLYLLVNLENLAIELEVDDRIIKSQMWQFQKLVTLKVNLYTSETLKNATENCCNLRKLDLTISNLQRSDVLSLCKCAQLDELRLFCLKISVSDVIYLLDNLAELRSLRLSVFEDDKIMLKLLTTLNEISCHKSYELKSICFFGSQALSHGLLVLLRTHFPKIQNLKVAPDSIKSVENFDHIKKLVIRDLMQQFTHIPRLVMTIPFEYCARIEELELHFVDAGGIFREDLEMSFPMLNRLTLTHCSNVDLPAIAVKCQNIEHLEIRNCHFIPLPAKESASQPYRYLKSIVFVGCFSKMHILFAVSFCKGLKTLRIDHFLHTNPVLANCGIDDSLIKCILDKNPMEKLEILCMTNDTLTFITVTTIMEALPQLHELFLNLKENELSAERRLWLKTKLEQFEMSKCCVNWQSF